MAPHQQGSDPLALSQRKHTGEALTYLVAVWLMLGATAIVFWLRPWDRQAVGNRSLRWLIDINTAGADTLCLLPGIGPQLAGRVVAHRDAHGPYRSVNQLQQVRGIGPKKVEGIRSLVRCRAMGPATKRPVCVRTRTGRRSDEGLVCPEFGWAQW